MKLKDIFLTEEKIESTPVVDAKSKTEKERMNELVKSFSEKNEIIKEGNNKTVDQEKVLKEYDRFKKLTNLNEFVTNNQFSGNIPSVLGRGQTVNTFMGGPGTTVNTFLQNNSPKDKFYNPNYTYLQPSEAIRLAISRVLNSGAPINDIGFYEEINQNLNKLGFDSKSPLDIKYSLLKMIQD